MDENRPGHRHDSLSLGASLAEAAGVLTIGRREDSTTFDPIKTAQNIDFWVFSNVYDVLVRVDKSGTKLEPGLAESWTVSEDGLTYSFTLRDAKFSDGSAITADDAVFSLTRIRDNEARSGATPTRSSRRRKPRIRRRWWSRSPARPRRSCRRLPCPAPPSSPRPASNRSARMPMPKTRLPLAHSSSRNGGAATG